ncbi:YihY family inner membrane protein [Azomonas macrocytogenes]|uniref:UPF0761 membrane protein FHR87_000633 n=1 Tax=Azomonas macrocytogenes TaxID=69962 RepID=A0A839T122_AZOMA|nr:YihY family inner membrane protein [Azomonas macrocytogenes]MBB3102260.1 membrane protein [Azomonas macrocytogenes]
MQFSIDRSASFGRFLIRRFLENRGLNCAAELTYTTLFAVVPMMTVTFAMLSVVPAFQGVGEQIQEYIFHNFIPSTGEAIQGYLTTFSTQARQLTWVGVGFLMLTSVMMLLTIENTFNTIWHIDQPRRGVSRLLLYWAVLTMGPLVLGAGFASTTYIASLSLISGPHALLGVGMFFQFVPLLLNMVAFTLIYITVPNTRVPLKHALIGGVAAAMLLEVARRGFSLYVVLFPSYELIYGAFAAVPLFLLWIYLSWLIVLLCAELVCGLSSSLEWRQRRVPRLLVMLTVLRIFHQRQQLGHAVRLHHAHKAGWPIPHDEWSQIMGFFERENLVTRTNLTSWVLCRDLGHYSLDQLLKRNPWPLISLDQLPQHFDEPWYPDFRAALEQWQQERSRLFGGSLAHWLDGKTS